jgi:hypothetical protein
MTETLFPDLVLPDPTPVEVKEKLSAGRRLTLRQKADIDAGRHPLIRGARLAGNGETCGSCELLVRVGWHNRTYLKCTLGLAPGRPLDEAPYAAHSAQTDCRAWWPACVNWKPTVDVETTT